MADKNSASEAQNFLKSAIFIDPNIRIKRSYPIPGTLPGFPEITIVASADAAVTKLQICHMNDHPEKSFCIQVPEGVVSTNRNVLALLECKNVIGFSGFLMKEMSESFFNLVREMRYVSINAAIPNLDLHRFDSVSFLILDLQDAKDAKIPWSQIEYFRGYFNPRKNMPEEFFGLAPILKSLILHSPKLMTASFANFFPKLKTLHLDPCRSLLNVDDLSALGELSEIRVDGARKVDSWRSLSDLHDLDNLSLLECGNVEIPQRFENPTGFKLINFYGSRPRFVE